jgi:hypothetical protein
MIDKELLDILVCPVCKTTVEPHGEGLRCIQCGRAYPVRDGIPIMLVDQSSPQQ